MSSVSSRANVSGSTRNWPRIREACGPLRHLMALRTQCVNSVAKALPERLLRCYGIPAKVGEDPILIWEARR